MTAALPPNCYLRHRPLVPIFRLACCCVTIRQEQPGQPHLPEASKAGCPEALCMRASRGSSSSPVMDRPSLERCLIEMCDRWSGWRAPALSPRLPPPSPAPTLSWQVAVEVSSDLCLPPRCHEGSVPFPRGRFLWFRAGVSVDSSACLCVCGHQVCVGRISPGETWPAGLSWALGAGGP